MPMQRRGSIEASPDDAIRTVVGIDQTGRSLGGGQRAAPLPVVVAHREAIGRWQIVTSAADGKPLVLPSCDEASLKAAANRSDLARTAVMIDCVFGLEASVWTHHWPELHGGAKLRRLLHAAARHEIISDDGRAKQFGLDVAHDFFSHLLPGPVVAANGPPRRAIERLVDANSVFRYRPYQRNIQCGTYRIWKDLGRDRDASWLEFWPFEPPSTADRPWFFESFPSLFWRSLFGMRTRAPERLIEVIAGIHERIAGLEITVDTLTHAVQLPDHADALVLALGGVVLAHEGRLFTPQKDFWRTRGLDAEGWIAGAVTR